MESIILTTTCSVAGWDTDADDVIRLRTIRRRVDGMLAQINGQLEAIYGGCGRPSIAPGLPRLLAVTVIVERFIQYSYSTAC